MIQRSKISLLVAVVLILVSVSFTNRDEPPDEIRNPASIDPRLFTDQTPLRGERIIAEEVRTKTGIPALRARKVRFNSEPLREALRPGTRVVHFDLFDDTRIDIEFFEPSAQLNRRGEFVGQVKGDADSQVHLWATQGELTGEILTKNHVFRFTPASLGLHYIIEETSRTNR